VIQLKTADVNRSNLLREKVAIFNTHALQMLTIEKDNVAAVFLEQNGNSFYYDASRYQLASHESIGVANGTERNCRLPH